MVNRTAEVKIQFSLPDAIPRRWDGFWMLLSDDFDALIRLRSRCGGDERRIGGAEELHDISSSLAPQFVSEVGEQSITHGDSLEWWISTLAGKNVLVSRLFLHITYAEMFRRHLQRLLKDGERDEKETRTLLVVCQDIFLLPLLKQIAGELGASSRVAMRSRLLHGWEILRVFGRWFARWGNGLSHTLRRLIAARLSRKTRLSGKERPVVENDYDILLHSCVDDSCLRPNGEFNDRYFPGLADWLRNRGWKVGTIPWLYSAGRSWTASYAALRSCEEEFLILEDFMTIRDIAPAIWRVLRAGRWNGRARALCGYRVESLLFRERLESSSDAKALFFHLYPPALRRWINSALAPKAFIDMFENMGPERPSIWAFRRYSPQTELIGYQHIGGIPRQQLSYTVTDGELTTGIFPDRIITNSQSSLAELVKGGFPRSMLAIGPALRFKHLYRLSLESDSKISTDGANRSLVLLLLPLEMSAAIELTQCSLSIADQLRSRGYRILAKAHPMMERTALEQKLRIGEWPSNWEWGNEPSDSYFSRTLFVIAEGSSLLDAAASGIPFVALHRELRPALNPLSSWWDEFPSSRNLDPRAFKANICTFIDACNSPSAERIALAQAIRTGLVEINDATLSVFLPTQRAAVSDRVQCFQ